MKLEITNNCHGKVTLKVDNALGIKDLRETFDAGETREFDKKYNPDTYEKIVHAVRCCPRYNPCNWL